MRLSDIMPAPKRSVVVYPGRFQPPMPHHRSVYQHLSEKFTDSEVYVAPTVKTGGDDHPFDITEKTQMFSQLHQISHSQIVPVTQPYRGESYHHMFDPETHALIVAVGGKDADRLLGRRMDPDTGTVLKASGEPAVIQPMAQFEQNPQPYAQHIYVYVTPTETVGDTVASASDFRQRFSDAVSDQAAADIFTEVFDQWNPEIFSIMQRKLRSSQ